MLIIYPSFVFKFLSSVCIFFPWIMCYSITILFLLCHLEESFGNKDLTSYLNLGSPGSPCSSSGCRKEQSSLAQMLVCEFLNCSAKPMFNSAQLDSLFTLLGTLHTENSTFLFAFISINKTLISAAPN